MFRKSRSQQRAFLSATSALAIIAGLGGNACAACTSFDGNNDFPGFENPVISAVLAACQYDLGIHRTGVVYNCVSRELEYPAISCL